MKQLSLFDHGKTQQQSRPPSEEFRSPDSEAIRPAKLPDPAASHAAAITVLWPPPLDAAIGHRLVGDLIRTIEPHTEADPAALVFQFLAAFGNCIGRTAYFMAEADRHYLNLSVVLVGRTAKGRKETSWGHIRRLFEAVDPEWVKLRVQEGLSSGEGLIWLVRDHITRPCPRGRTRPVAENVLTVADFEASTRIRPSGVANRRLGLSYGMNEGDPEVLDEGIKDKRLLLVESEFVATLRVLGRSGNTLSPLIRQAWDRGDLQSLTKNSPAKATGAHISIVGHITRDELVRYLSQTELSNGFANRFLWVCAQRSKRLPRGGQIREADWKELAARLDRALAFGRNCGELTMNEEAWLRWDQVYDDLSAGKPGRLGAVTSRAEAQVKRLAGCYAVLDLSSVIRREHLDAALALWKYAQNSARYIFGDTLGDPVADQVLARLRQCHPQRITRTEINQLFSGNKRADRIAPALARLLEEGLAQYERVPTRGRPVERWFLSTNTEKTE